MKKYKSSKKARETSKRWYEEHKEKIKDYYKDFYKNNKYELQIASKQRADRNKILRNSRFQKQGKSEKDFDKAKKNQIRQNLVNIARNHNIKSILTLESSDYFFSKEFPDKEVYVFEYDPRIYKELVAKKPKNVFLFDKEVSSFANLPFNVDFIYLDFCGTFRIEKENIFLLRDKIAQTKLFAVTLCVRDDSPSIGDYPYHIISQIQEITGLNLKVLYGEAYKDKGSPAMVTILFENKGGYTLQNG